MVIEREVIDQRLKELDEILGELDRYRSTSWERFQTDLGLRWIVERGLIAAAAVVFDVADHVLAGHFGVYPETYEDSLTLLCDQGVISEALYQQIRGLGGFRNILVHRYLDIDPREVFENWHKGRQVLPAFAQEILAWLDREAS